MPSYINKPNIRESKEAVKSLNNKEYGKFYYDYDGLPAIRAGEDEMNTVTEITYNSNGKPATIKKYAIDPTINDKAKLYTFEYNDVTFPNKPTKITVETASAI